MNPADRTPIILACVADILAERATADDRFPSDQSALLRALTGVATDPVAIARLWPATSDDAIAAHHVMDILDGDPGDSSTARRQKANVVAVAAHFAAVAAALHVRGKDAGDAPRVLWLAASRLLGHQTATHADIRNLHTEATNTRTAAKALDEGAKSWRSAFMTVARAVGLNAETIGPAHDALVVQNIEILRANLRAWREWAVRVHGALLDHDDHAARCAIDEAMRDAARRHNEEMRCIEREHLTTVARLTADLATARADLEEALRSPVSAGPSKAAVAAAAQPHDDDDGQAGSGSYHLRSVVLKAGAKDCRVFIGPNYDDLMIVVELREGVTLDTIRKAVDGVLPLGKPYTLREVGYATITSKCRHHADGDAAACDHCSLKSSG